MYKAQNIDTDKILEELNRITDQAVKEHLLNKAIEEARYRQQMDDINRFKDMFFCSNFEKIQKAGDTK